MKILRLFSCSYLKTYFEFYSALQSKVVGYELGYKNTLHSEPKKTFCYDSVYIQFYLGDSYPLLQCYKLSLRLIVFTCMLCQVAFIQLIYSTYGTTVFLMQIIGGALDDGYFTPISSWVRPMSSRSSFSNFVMSTYIKNQLRFHAILVDISYQYSSIK